MPSSCPAAGASRRLPRCVAILCSLAATAGPLRAFDSSLPPHPTVITADIAGGTAPVVGVQDQQPLVRGKDGLETVNRDSPFHYNRAWRFAPGTVSISGEKATSHETKIQTGPSSSSVLADGVSYTATITASTTYPRAYVMVLFVDRNFLQGTTDQPTFGVFFQNLGTLPAQQATKADIYINWNEVPPQLRSRLTFFPLVFSEGVEIQSNREDMAAAFFRRLELVTFKKAMSAYLEQYAAADHELKIFLSVPPYLPEAAGQSPLPASVKVSFVVTPEGTVNSFALADPLPAAAAEAVRRSVSAWLFLPRLERGMPQPTAVNTSVPLGVAGRGKG